MQHEVWIIKYLLNYNNHNSSKKNGVSLTSVSNPGWWLDVDLHDTPFASIKFDSGLVELSEHDWYFVTFKDKKFKASGDTRKLSFLFSEFNRICSLNDPEALLSSDTLLYEILNWISKWRAKYCNVEWERENLFKVNFTPSFEWNIYIDVLETSLENILYSSGVQKISDDDWYTITIEKSIFTAAGDVTKLPFLLGEFRRLNELFGEDLTQPRPTYE